MIYIDYRDCMVLEDLVNPQGEASKHLTVGKPLSATPKAQKNSEDIHDNFINDVPRPKVESNKMYGQRSNVYGLVRPVNETGPAAYTRQQLGLPAIPDTGKKITQCSSCGKSRCGQHPAVYTNRLVDGKFV